MDLVTESEIVEEVLRRFDVSTAYRHHVYRGLNYQLALLDATDVPDEIAFAWALHDIGLFTDGWDYLEPSLRQVDALAAEFGIAETARVRAMVAEHHKIRPVDDEWVETFRVADRIDVSHGVWRDGVSRTAVKAIAAAHPYVGFHAFLARTAAGWAVRHPLRPMPMLRW